MDNSLFKNDLFQIKKKAFRAGRPFSIHIRSFLTGLLDFICPPICLLCDARLEKENPICDLCWKTVLDSVKIQHQRKKKDFPHLSEKLTIDCATTCWPYTPEIERIIHQIKYQKWRKLGVFFGKQMGNILKKDFKKLENTWMIPVPLHKIRRRDRGFNQSELLCGGLATVIPVPVHEKILVRLCDTKSQTKLSARERELNVEDVFAVQNPRLVDGKRIFLVDDVVTTGATVNACAKVLKEAGAEQVIGIALARPQIL
jgi:ComF family protein